MDKDTVIRREIHTAAAGLHVRETGEGEAPGRTISGYAILFGTPSAPFYSDDEGEVREVIDPEAVTQELLDSSDIKFTLFHDRQLLLARSKQGKGTLTYERDERGVKFSFEAPHTADGEKALELVRSGIIDGCSFAFSTRYYDSAFVERTVKKEGKKNIVTCRVKVMTGIYDMTLTPDPAYPATEVANRELAQGLAEHPGRDDEEPEQRDAHLAGYIREMREAARRRR